MDKLVPTLVAIAIAALILFLLVYGWRRRAKRDSGLGASYDVPADAAPATLEAETLYVATTVHDKPLERLVPMRQPRDPAREVRREEAQHGDARLRHRSPPPAP